MPWNRIIGHGRIIARLRTALSSGRLHPALLFEGPEGIGKRLIAVTLTQALNCPQAPSRDWDPCGECRVCLAIAASAEPGVVSEGQSLHPGVRFVGPSRPDEREGRFGGGSSRGDVRSQIAVSQVRAVLAEGRGGSLAGGQRTIVIDPADRLGEGAANALLKTLEEPSSSERFILITSRPSALLPTIVSRCCRFRFGLMSDADVLRAVETLAPRPSAPMSRGERGPAPTSRGARGPAPMSRGERAPAGRADSARADSVPHAGKGSDASARRAELELITSLAGGRVGRALMLAGGDALEAFRTTRKPLLEALQALAAGLPGGTFAVLSGASFRARERDEWVEAIGVLELLLRDIAILSHDRDAGIVNADLAGQLVPLSVALGSRAARALSVLDAVRSDLRFNVAGRLAAERILIEIAR